MKSEPVSYDSKICRNLTVALKKEWEEKNDLGASSSSTIVGANTKPEHGLLVLPSKSSEKNILLSNLEETLFIGERSYSLSTHLYHENVFPNGYENLEHFYRLPFPTWIYRVDGLTLVKMVILIHGENSVLIRYQLLSSYGDYIRLQIRPMISCKEIPDVNPAPGMVEISSTENSAPLFLFHNSAVIERKGQWYRNLKEGDLYSPCSFLYAFLREDGVYLSVSVTSERKFDPFLIGVKEKSERKKRVIPPEI